MQYECAENESRTTAAEPIKPMQYADVGLPMEIDKTHLAPEAPVPTQYLPETNRSWLLVHHYYTFIPYIVITSYLVRYFVYRCFLVLLALRLVHTVFPTTSFVDIASALYCVSCKENKDITGNSLW
jgi:hypothetical protein